VNKFEVIIGLIVILAVVGIYLSIGLAHSNLYDFDDYCCTHMSRNIEDFLEAYYIPVEVITGHNYEEKEYGHMWVRVLGVNIDSVTLLPLDLKGMYPDDIEVYDDYEDW